MTTPIDQAKKDKMLERVRKALALAESERELGHEATADAHTATAMRLMATYGIDEKLAKARAKTKAEPVSKRFHVSAPYAGTKAHLLHVVAKALHCSPITIYAPGADERVHVFGFESDIELVEMLYTSLLLQMSHAVARMDIPPWLKGRAVMAERRSFMLGFASGVQPRLEAAYALAVEEADDSGTTGKEMVLASRDVDVKSAMEAEYPQVRKTRITYRGSGFGDGHKAGQRANIHDRPTVGGGGRALTR